MAITFVQKSDLNQKKDNPKIALVLSGGSISGGAYKIGGLKALNDFLVNRKLTEFDIYVGLSAGAFLAVPLCGGISPEEMLASLDGKSKKYSQLSPFDLYRPNVSEFFLRPLKYLYGNLSFLPGAIFNVLRAAPKLRQEFYEHALEFFKQPTYSAYERLTRPLLKVAFSSRTIPNLSEVFPSGLFDNQPLETYMRKNMKLNKMPNNFRVIKRMTGKSLYISAMDLDTADRVIFGPDEKNDVTISEAVQASTSTPGFYRPARIKGIDYIDGAVRRTANIDIALDRGADLVICYNPFRPFHNDLMLEYIREDNKYITANKRLSDYGIGVIFAQVFRTLFHSRLQAGLKILNDDPNFKSDVIVIEPHDSSDFSTMNPLFFWNRAKAAKIGFDSVTKSITEQFERMSNILNAYGIRMTREVIDDDISIIRNSNMDDKVIMDVLESRKNEDKGQFKVLHGGRH